MKILSFSIHLVLILGAITMIYPFLIMVSSSFKSHVDESSMSLIPEFLYKDEVLFKKYMEVRFNEESSLLAAQFKNKYLSFGEIELPKEINQPFITDWNQFLQENQKLYGSYDCYLGESYGRKIYGRHERILRKQLIAESGKDLDKIGLKYNCSIKSWDELKIEEKEITNRNYAVGNNPLYDRFVVYRNSLPAWQKVFVSLDGDFIRNELVQTYGENISKMNDSIGTKYNSWSEVVLSETLPNDLLKQHWQHYVQSVLNMHFVKLNAKVQPDWQKYLLQKYQNVNTLNLAWQKEYKSFADIPLFNTEEPKEAALQDWIFFVERLTKPEDLIVKSTESDFRKWLAVKYESIDKLNTVWGKTYPSFNMIPVDYQQIDYTYLQQNKHFYLGEFLKRNYTMVWDELAGNGRALMNTLIYTLLAILSAVIINPLAAYALSRFRPKLTNQLLMLFMLTMAFPTMVMGIPNFILLKNLNLLNTFWALILPGIADGYFIFLLKGFFDSQPRELYESAMLDGASEMRIFWQIAMSLSKPVLAVIALGAFNEAYRNFMYAFLVCQDQSMWTLMVHIYQLMQRSIASVGYAALVIVSIPTLMVFIFFQNIIIKGIVVPTEK